MAELHLICLSRLLVSSRTIPGCPGRCRRENKDGNSITLTHYHPSSGYLSRENDGKRW